MQIMHCGVAHMDSIICSSNLIILDEAHNLIDTILSTHTVVVTSASIVQARQALEAYLERFKSRLKGSNAMHLKQFVGVVGALEQFCGEWIQSDAKEEIKTASDFVRSLKGSSDQVNFLQLGQYLKESKMAFKASTVRASCSGR
jgi:chromosome transmission fidelity protein 1